MIVEIEIESKFELVAVNNESIGEVLNFVIEILIMSVLTVVTDAVVSVVDSEVVGYGNIEC